MMSKSKLVLLKYYECPQVAINLVTNEILQNPKYIDHDILLLVDYYIDRKGGWYNIETLARVTYRKGKWYWSLEPRIECEQQPLISMANLARENAIKHEDNVLEYYWLRASYKMEGIYR